MTPSDAWEWSDEKFIKYEDVDQYPADGFNEICRKLDIPPKSTLRIRDDKFQGGFFIKWRTNPQP